MGEFTCGSEGYPGTNHFKETCKGSEVINKAAAGTTAYQWRVGGDQEASEAFAAAGSGVTHVWLSVGGNDFQSPAEGGGGPGSDSAACKMSTADLSSRMQSAIDGVNAAATANSMANIKIIVTGYCVPMGAVLAEIGCAKDDMATLTSAYTKMAADNANVEFHDISAQCQQKKEYFISDGLHLNAKGYCKSLSLSTVQTAFGCGEKTYDCATVKSTACDGKESTSAVGNVPGSGLNLGHGMTWVTLGAAVTATMMALAL